MAEVDELEEERLREILSYYQSKPGELIPILLAVQANFGYIPDWVIEFIATFLSISIGEVYAVATFYAMFRLTPLGRNRVTVCRGTACHIRGAPHILREIEGAIDLKEGETSEDLEYTLETVACIGCCALAPCLTVNGRVHGEMTTAKARALFPNKDEKAPDEQ
ncbi:MAG: NAD(P)H-dependent oxidoreductase subunit E [Chloroflexota bacterium]